MPNYKILLDSPTVNVHAAMQNLGDAIQEKAGVFTVRLLDEQLAPLEQHEHKLPVSKQLGECYVYVSATPAGGLISLGEISARRPFQGLEIQYEGIFTDRPLGGSQLGLLFCTTELKEPGARSRATTKLARPQFAKKGDKE